GAPGVTYVSAISGPPRPPDLMTPVIVAGRDARDDAADEIVVPEVFAKTAHLEIGDTMRLKLLTPTEVTEFDTGFGEPDGPRVRLKVVGIARIDRDFLDNGLGPVFGTPALFRAHTASEVGNLVLVALDRGPAGVPAFRKELAPLARRTPTDATGKE